MSELQLQAPRFKVRFQERSPDLGGGEAWDVFVTPRETGIEYPQRVATVYPWYVNYTTKIEGWAWMTLPNTIGIPRMIVPRPQVVPDPAAAVHWCHWYLEVYLETVA